MQQILNLTYSDIFVDEDKDITHTPVHVMLLSRSLRPLASSNDYNREGTYS